MCNSTGEERFENGTASIASIEQVRMEDLHDAMEIKAKSSVIIRQSSFVSRRSSVVSHCSILRVAYFLFANVYVYIALNLEFQVIKSHERIRQSVNGDQNENENQSCAYTLTGIHVFWRRIHDCATDRNGSQGSSAPTEGPM